MVQMLIQDLDLKLLYILLVDLILSFYPLVKNKCLINIQDDGFTPLHWSVRAIQKNLLKN